MAIGVFVRVCKRFYASLGCHGADARFLGETTQPLNILRLKFGPLASHELDQGDFALKPPDDRPVLGRHVHDEIRGDDRGRTLLILGKKGRIPGNVLSKVAPDQPGIEVVPTTGSGSDNDLDPLAFIKIFDVIGGIRAGDNS